MRQDLKLKLAAAVCAGACLLMFAGLLRAGPVPCDAQAARFAWASPNAAAFAWASQADCHCKPSCTCSPCACAELPVNSRPAQWKHVGGDEYHLILPPHCNGQRCLPEQIIGGWNGQFRYWDGKAWGPVVQPPIAPPATPVLKQATNRWTLSDVATLITAALVGVVDDCPGGVCPPKAAGKPPTTFSGVSVKGHDAVPKHAVAEGPRRKAKRVVAAPFRMVKGVQHAVKGRMHVRRGR